jgi:hypothetical protein
VLFVEGSITGSMPSPPNGPMVMILGRGKTRVRIAKIVFGNCVRKSMFGKG